METEMIKLYNTRSKTIEALDPLTKTTRIYTCGPTVYDSAHIGNLSSYIYADTLRRMIVSTGLPVQHTMNITDVDDKTIRRSLEDDHAEEPMTALLDFTAKLTDVFYEDMKAVGNDLQAFTFVKATDHIEHMQTIIKHLLDQGIAYIADDGVYFSIKAYRATGKTYGQLLKLSEESTSEARIDNDEYDKESAHDFALWKKRKEGEPYWQFEINGQELDGRPGWHIECSAMSEATLGLPFDIHTGGIDLIFPHHENEIAQSTAGSDQNVMATIFFHNEHLLVDGKKMSKSLGNFLTLNNIRSKGIDPLAFRLTILQSHYRSQSNFTWEALEAANTVLQDIRAWADLRFQNLSSSTLKEYYEETMPLILEAMQDDLRTPEAIAHLVGMVKKAGEIGADSVIIGGILPVIESLFGLNLLERQDINQPQSALLRQRAEARAQKDWARSDQLRDELKSQDIAVRDSDQGQVWSRI